MPELPEVDGLENICPRHPQNSLPPSNLCSWKHMDKCDPPLMSHPHLVSPYVSRITDHLRICDDETYWTCALLSSPTRSNSPQMTFCLFSLPPHLTKGPFLTPVSPLSLSDEKGPPLYSCLAIGFLLSLLYNQIIRGKFCYTSLKKQA